MGAGLRFNTYTEKTDRALPGCVHWVFGSTRIHELLSVGKHFHRLAKRSFNCKMYEEIASNRSSWKLFFFSEKMSEIFEKYIFFYPILLHFFSSATYLEIVFFVHLQHWNSVGGSNVLSLRFAWIFNKKAVGFFS